MVLTSSIIADRDWNGDRAVCELFPESFPESKTGRLPKRCRNWCAESDRNIATTFLRQILGQTVGRKKLFNQHPWKWGVSSTRYGHGKNAGEVQDAGEVWTAEKEASVVRKIARSIFANGPLSEESVGWLHQQAVSFVGDFPHENHQWPVPGQVKDAWQVLVLAMSLRRLAVEPSFAEIVPLIWQGMWQCFDGDVQARCASETVAMNAAHRPKTMSDTALADEFGIDSVLQIELPLVLAFFVAKGKSRKRAVGIAEDHFERCLLGCLTPAGDLHRELSVNRLTLLAIGTRAQLWRRLNRRKRGLIDSLFEQFVARQIFLLRRDGSTILDKPNSNIPGLLKIAVELFQGKSTRRLVQDLLKGKKTAYDASCKPRISSELVSTMTSELDEAGGIALLRTSWNRNAIRLGVDFSQPTMSVDLSAKSPVINGLVATHCGDVKKASESLWTVQEYFSSDDIESIEWLNSVGLETINSWNRQVVVSHEERFFLSLEWANCRSPIRTDWTLDRSVEIMLERKTNEVYLLAKEKICSLILPLSIGEWTTPETKQQWAVRPGLLSLQSGAVGLGDSEKPFPFPSGSASDFAAARVRNFQLQAMLIDLRQERCMQPRTWRMLAVARDGKPCHVSEAAAWRVRIGSLHLLIYRSFSPPAARSILGRHLNCRFFVGRIDRRGNVKTLMKTE